MGRDWETGWEEGRGRGWEERERERGKEEDLGRVGWVTAMTQSARAPLAHTCEGLSIWGQLRGPGFGSAQQQHMASHAVLQAMGTGFFCCHKSQHHKQQLQASAAQPG